MVDIVDKKTRSRMMRAIKSKNTKPEILVRKCLHKKGYRYRLGSKVGKRKPDIVLRKYKVAVFVHGCFWHQHVGCRLAYSDRVYSDKWIKKFQSNINRDKQVEQDMLSKGWRIAIIWECVTRDKDRFGCEISKLDHWIREENRIKWETEYKK